MIDQEQQTRAEHPEQTHGVWLLPFLALCAAGIVFLRTHSIGMMGFDSYPLILTARIESWADFLGTFTEELMAGRYSSHFYRPLLNLSFALDHLLWGLDPWGYQLTGALLFGACGAALGLFMRRLLGADARLGPLVGLLFFLLHDSHFEVIPVPARRPEMLCALFACLSLASQLKREHLARRWPVAPALWMLLAAASKEMGYALPAVSVVLVLLYSPLETLRARGLHALRAGAVHAAAIGTLLVLRLSVLGGLGGPAPLPAGFQGDSSLELSRTLLRDLLLPRNLEAWGAAVPALAVLAGLGVLALLVLGRAPGADPKARPMASRGLAVSLVWIALITLLYGSSRTIEQWYFFLPVVGLSMFVGAAVELALTELRQSQTVRRRVAMGVLPCLLGFATCQVRYTPLLHSFPEWTAATAASEEFLSTLEKRIERVPAGSPIVAPPLPVWYPPAESGPTLRGVAMLKSYSVQAWLELVHADRTFQVLRSPLAAPLPAGVSAVQLRRVREF